NHPDSLSDFLPENIRQALHYPSIAEALETLHNPPAHISTETLLNGDLPALKRLAFEELLAHHLTLLLGKQHYKTWQAPSFYLDLKAKQSFIAQRPFQLTKAQLRVISEIEADCSKPQPMLRLVQGDVGSGKSLVAAISALAALSSGF